MRNGRDLSGSGEAVLPRKDKGGKEAGLGRRSLPHGEDQGESLANQQEGPEQSSSIRGALPCQALRRDWMGASQEGCGFDV